MFCLRSFHLSSDSSRPPAAVDLEFCGETCFSKGKAQVVRSLNKSLNRFPHTDLYPLSGHFHIMFTLFFSLSSLCLPFLTAHPHFVSFFMSALTKFLNVFSVVIYEILIFFRGTVSLVISLQIAVLPLHCCFQILLYNQIVCSAGCLPPFIFVVDEIWVFVSIAAFSYLFKAWWLLLLMWTT